MPPGGLDEAAGGTDCELTNPLPAQVPNHGEGSDPGTAEHQGWRTIAVRAAHLTSLRRGLLPSLVGMMPFPTHSVGMSLISTFRFATVLIVLISTAMVAGVYQT